VWSCRHSTCLSSTQTGCLFYFFPGSLSYIHSLPLSVEAGLAFVPLCSSRSALFVSMDPGRLPAYRSSYLLRFHPYPRVKPSTRERVVASTCGDEQYYSTLLADTLHSETEIPFTLNQAVHGTDVDDKIQLPQRRLSISSLVVELALIFAKKA